MSELVTIDDAFAAALDDPDSAPTEEVVEQASEEVFVDEPEQATSESEAEAPLDEPEELFDDLDVDGNDAEVEQPVQVDLEALSFELPGVDAPVSFQELRDGYLRQADYTRKTQALAEQRKDQERAIKLYEAIQADPMAVARQIAEETGLVQQGDQPFKAVEFSVFNTQEAVEQEIQRRVDEAIVRHPAVVEANEQRARDWIGSEFARIEQTHGVTLGPKSRERILSIAADRQVADLELVFNALMAQKQARSEQARQAANAAPGRPTNRRAEAETPVEDAKTVEEAFEMAMAGID